MSFKLMIRFVLLLTGWSRPVCIQDDGDVI